MSTIKNILIPTDFSETASLAVAHGVNMANLFNAKIFLLHSVEINMYAATPLESAVVRSLDDVYKDAEIQLGKEAAEIKNKYKVEVTTLIVSGKPTSSITEAVKEHAIDIIIMGTHGASGVEEFFLGSNAHKVVSVATCPVITVRLTTKNIGFSNIIMPIASGFHSRQKVNNVIAIASTYNSTVHILGLLETNDSTDDKKFKIKLEAVEQLLKKENIKFTTKLIRARKPALEAMKYSDEIGGDLIVIMTDYESDLSAAFLWSSSSRQIVNHAKIPVMSIRPIDAIYEDLDPSGGTGPY